MIMVCVIKKWEKIRDSQLMYDMMVKTLRCSDVRVAQEGGPNEINMIISLAKGNLFLLSYRRATYSIATSLHSAASNMMQTCSFVSHTAHE